MMTGEEFKKARIRAQITQQQLGEMLGYKGRSAGNTVQKWEYDYQPIPTKHWKKLSKILRLPLDAFLPEE